MLRRLPPLNALRPSRLRRERELHASGAELCVTPAAVSQQVKALEATLGIKLFIRERQRLVITGPSRISCSGPRCAGSNCGRYGASCPAPDLRSFDCQHLTGFCCQMACASARSVCRGHPDIDLRVSATMHHVDFAREDVDLAVRHGDGNWAGLGVVRLCASSFFRSAARRWFRDAIA